jgi:nitrite reductase/ring-hydroxylating ferredoxin subunit
VGFGILGAAAAAAAGLTDWKEIDGRGRRAGLAHALLNSVALLLFVKSWLLRRTGDRAAGRLASGLGYGIASVSAVLGGDLVYGLRIGVNYAADEDLPSDYVAVLTEGELPEDVLRRVQVGRVPVLLTRQGDQVLAIGERCSHLGGPLSEGRIEGGSVICPWHGSRFALATGRVLDGPATFPEPRFEARVREGQIEVRSTAG